MKSRLCVYTVSQKLHWHVCSERVTFVAKYFSVVILCRECVRMRTDRQKDRQT